MTRFFTAKPSGKFTAAAVLLCVVAIMVSGCISYYPGSRYGENDNYPNPSPEEYGDGVLRPLCFGYGAGPSMEKAEDAALRDAVQRTAWNILGSSSILYQLEVKRATAQISSLDQYFLSGTVRVYERDWNDGNYEMIVQARIDASAVADLLSERGIASGLLAEGRPVRLPDEEPPVIERDQPLSEVLTYPAFKQTQGNLPTFIVYVHSGSYLSPFLRRSAVTAANSRLLSLGFSYIDYDQVMEVIEDQDMAYTDITGRASALRYLASEFRADYYIDAAVQIASKRISSGYQADATVTLTCYDAVTASGKGSVIYQLERPVQSGNSMQAAEVQAVSAAVEQGTSQLLQQIGDTLVKEQETGTQYEIIFIDTPGSRLMHDFEQLMRNRGAELYRESYSVDETRYVLYSSGSVSEVEQLVYSIADMFPELQDTALMYQRGNSLTFTAGFAP